MTDAEIINALKICSNKRIGCKRCPYLGIDGCIRSSMLDTIDLIQRQQKRIERLKDNLDAVLKERADHTEAIEKFADRIVEQLEEMHESLCPDDDWFTAEKVYECINIVKGVQNGK